MSESVVSRESFSRFSDPFCELVLSYLSLEDQTRCECVSHSFRRCVYKHVFSIAMYSPLFEGLVCKAPDGEKGGTVAASGQTLPAINTTLLESILRKCPQISEFHFTGLMLYSNAGAIVDTIIRSCHHLTTADISNTSDVLAKTGDDDDDDVIAKFLERFGPQLTGLRITFRQRFQDYRDKKILTIDGLKWCPNVTHFHCTLSDLRLAQLFTADENKKFYFKGLVDFGFTYGKHDRNRFKSFVDISSPTLKCLSICMTSERADMCSLLIQIAKLVHLRQLIISRAYGMGIDYDMTPYLKTIATECQSLAKLSLDLRFCSKLLSYETFEAMKYFKHLKRLSLELDWIRELKVVNSSDNEIFFKCKPLMNCKRLTHLYLHRLVLNDIFFYNIDKHLPKLRHLYINSNYKEKLSLSDTTIKVLAKLTKLEYIFFSEDQPKITDPCVYDLIHKCRKIKRIAFGFTGNRRFDDQINEIHNK